MSDSKYKLMFDKSASGAIDEYLEYQRIVGDDDGGTPFTPAQYEKYKKRVTPMRINNRLYVAWSNQEGMDCKLIGPETECFCNHRFKQHKTDFEEIPSERPVKQKCRVPGCKCVTYKYVPRLGKQAARCSKCKHTSDEHNVKQPHNCKKGNCTCDGFRSAITCSCKQAAYNHHMIVETKAERLARGHPVGKDTIYQAMGGLTGFSSLMDGYMRLDPSGIGAPTEEFLNQPITSSDHPFLRANAESVSAYKKSIRAPQEEVDVDLAERLSAIKKPGEDDMDFYERRYQERQKAARIAARGITGRSTKETTNARDSQDMAIAGSNIKKSREGKM